MWGDNHCETLALQDVSAFGSQDEGRWTRCCAPYARIATDFEHSHSPRYHTKRYQEEGQEEDKTAWAIVNEGTWCLTKAVSAVLVKLLVLRWICR